MRDVNSGWVVRYTHANVASFFFIFVYAHIARGLYYSSYKTPRILVWTIGVIILILMMAIAFLGYFQSLTWYNTINILPYDYYLSSISVLPLTQSPRCDAILKTLKVKPKAVFEELHKDGAKATVSKCINSFTGVYLIINLINSKVYVGSAIKGRMANRLHKHLFGLNGSKLVATAVAKYGLANFAFVLADTLPIVVTQENNKALLEMVDHYIQLLQPAYNIAAKAGNTFGVKHTEDTKLKMRINY